MANILYTYHNQVYVNLTNECDCSCRFCIRQNGNGVGDAETLWHKETPSLNEVIAAMDAFDFTGVAELVYCGYGEPTCALENLIASAKYAKEKFGLSIRLNTNGLGNLYHKRDIVPELAEVVDTVSISLNAPDAEGYDYITRPKFANAFEGLLAFAKECKDAIPNSALTVVDVLSKEDIKKSQEVADSIGIRLRVREYEG